MIQVYALDLKDDPTLVAEYESHHQQIWPEVKAYIESQGVKQMHIYRLGTRLVMCTETDEQTSDSAAQQGEDQIPAVIAEWERLMDTYQTATPWSQPGQKWTPMTCIFDLNS